MTLLKRGTGQTDFSDQEYRETAIKLQQTLQNFGVGVTVTNISCGPTVTRYELHPSRGVKVYNFKIVALADDIKLNLAAADIRMEAQIPGKAAVGIEVPNKENHVVLLRDLLESEAFKKYPSRLAFAVGKRYRRSDGCQRHCKDAAYADRRIHRFRKIRLHQYADYECDL